MQANFKPRQSRARACAASAGRSGSWPAFQSSPHWRSAPQTRRLRHAGPAIRPAFTRQGVAAAFMSRPAFLRRRVVAAVAGSELSGVQTAPASGRCVACRPLRRVEWSSPAPTRRRT